MMITRQEIFDLAWKGLKAQGFEKSYDPSFGCLYRGPEGRRCAIGHVIPDDRYATTLEGKSPLTIEVSSAANLSENDTSFADDLQMCHDKADTPNGMRKRLTDFAAKHHLTIPAES